MARPSVLIVHPSCELYGADRMFLESVTALVDDGWDVVAVVCGEGPLVAELTGRGARVVRCPTPVLRKAALRPRGFLRLLGEAVRAVVPTVRLLLTERVDVVYVNTLTIPLWPVLARALRHRVVAHVHEAEEAGRVVRAALALPLLTCTVVLVNSRATASLLHRSLPVLRRRTRLLHNGGPGPGEHREAAAPRDPAHLVLVGRLSPRKGTDVAVEAVAWLARAGRPTTLTLVGSVFSGYEWYEERLRELIRSRGLDTAVELRGFTDDVWADYARADVALVPSRFEPFGNTAVEAQLAGVPVVVSEVQGLPETVGYGRRGRVVAPDDPAALGAAIADLLDDWPRTRETARAARHEATALFSPDRYRRDLARIVAETRAAGERSARRLPR